jgi:hypothetical protein
MTTSIPTPDEINALSATEFKTYENRLRRAADRQGLRLEKARVRDPRAIDHGTYRLVNIRTNVVEAFGSPNGYGLNPVDVARALFDEFTVHVDYSPDHS